MKEDITKRPKNFKELKEGKEYKNWKKALPTYIPKMFEDQA